MGSPDPSALPVDALLDRIPITQAPRIVTPLQGGLVNSSYRVQVGDEDLVVRVGTPNLEFFGVDRDIELENTRAAATGGVAPEVVASYPELGVLVSRFVQGRPLHDDDLQDAEILSRVALRLRQLHDGPAFRGSFDVTQFRRNYLDRVTDDRLPLPPHYLDDLSKVDSIEARLAASPEVLVPCHNDLGAANIIDGGAQLWFLDFEFAAMNEPSFDIANCAVSAQLPLDSLSVFVDAYWRQPSSDKLARALGWMVVAAYTWVLWTTIQARDTTADFDFMTWGEIRYEKAREMLNQPEFWRSMDEVAR